MTDEFRGDLFTSYAEEYFARYPIFKHVADRVGNNSFFITGATGLFGSWILAFLHWTIKRKFAEPRLLSSRVTKPVCFQAGLRWLREM